MIETRQSLISYGKSFADTFSILYVRSLHDFRYVTYKIYKVKKSIVYQVEYVDLSVQFNGAVLYRALRSKRT